jgi:hypothetical protein
MKGNNKYTTEMLTLEAAKHNSKADFKRAHDQAYRSAIRKGILEQICSHMTGNIIYWTEEDLSREASKYKHRGDFQKFSKNAWQTARKRNLLDKICSHMEYLSRPKYSPEELKEIASQYKTRSGFEHGNVGAYNSARKQNLMNEICTHMEVKWEKKWDFESIQKEALKYTTRKDFGKYSRGAYKAAQRLNIINDTCGHAKSKSVRYTTTNSKLNNEQIKEKATKFASRFEFQKESPSAYSAALRRNILDQVCSHMKLSSNISLPERNLFDLIKEKYPKAQRLKDRKVKIANKPHIKGLELDIYIPELRKGIEFDGSYWHSIEGLKRSRADWPHEDLENYHQIKDEYFKSRNIELLHISEMDWKENKENCIKKCFDFLEKGNG